MSDRARGLPPHRRRAVNAAVTVVRAVAVVVVVAVTGCTSGAMSAGEFRAGARQSIEQMVAAVGTAGFAARLADDDKAFDTYLAVLTEDARQDGESARQSATTLEPPPDLGSLEGELDRLLGDAVDTLRAADDAAQDVGPAALAAQAARLEDLSERLADLKGRLA